MFVVGDKEEVKIGVVYMCLFREPVLLRCQEQKNASAPLRDSCSSYRIEDNTHSDIYNMKLRVYRSTWGMVDDADGNLAGVRKT